MRKQNPILTEMAETARRVWATPDRDTDHLWAWLNRPDVQRYLGRTFTQRIILLGWVIDPRGRKLTDIAREFGISKQAIHRLAKQARAIGKQNN